MSDDAWVLAIDFGTSSTAAAIGRDGGAELVAVDGGLPRMLSNVFLQEPTGKLLLGDVAENASTFAPWCFERCPKLKLGQQYMLLGNRRVSVTDAVGQVLHKVAADAIRMRGGDKPAVVRLTHPVRWGEQKRNALIASAESAGLDGHLELVLEPAAAAMHFAHERLEPGQHVAVYDLGGGTLDTAVLERTEDGFEVIGEPRGIEGFGGEDFDHRLYLYLGAQLPPEDWGRLRAEPEPGGDTSWTKANRELQRNVRRAKELLTYNDEVDVDVPSLLNRMLRVTRDEFNQLICADIEGSVRELARSIESAGLEPSDLVAVYLAGGCGQIPLVSEVIQQRLGIVPQHLNDSKSVICLGAALPPPALDGGDERARSVVADPVAAVPGQATRGRTVTERELPPTAPAVTLPPTVGARRVPATPAVRLDADRRARNPAASGTRGSRPPAETAHPRRRWIAGVGSAVAVAAVAAAAVLVLSRSHSKHPHHAPTAAATAPARTASSGPISISYRSPWKPAGSGVKWDSLIRKPIALSDGKTTLAAGPLLKSAALPGDPPPGLVTSDGQPHSTGTVTLDPSTAKQYGWTPANGRDVDAFVIPTETGDLAAICQATTAGASLSSCTKLASQLKLTGAHTLQPGPDKRLTAAITAKLNPALQSRSAIGTLDEPTLGARAAAAVSVASADSRAATEISQLTVPHRFQSRTDKLVSSLRAESGALNGMANDASDSISYDSDIPSTDDASKQLATAAAALAPSGIQLPTVSTFELASAPAPPVTTSTTQTQTTPVQNTTPAPALLVSGTSNGQMNDIVTKPSQFLMSHYLLTKIQWTQWSNVDATGIGNVEEEFPGAPIKRYQGQIAFERPGARCGVRTYTQLWLNEGLAATLQDAGGQCIWYIAGK